MSDKLTKMSTATLTKSDYNKTTERDNMRQRIKELERHNADCQMRLVNLRRGLEHVGSAPDWETALKYVHAALIHDIHDGFGTFYFEQLERHNKLLRAVVNEIGGEEYCPLCYANIDEPHHNPDCELQAAIDGGALDGEK